MILSFALGILNLAWKGLLLYMVVSLIVFLTNHGKGLISRMGENFQKWVELKDEETKRKLLKRYKELHKDDMASTNEDANGA